MFGPSSEQFELASVQVNGLALKTAAIAKINTNTNKNSLSLCHQNSVQNAKSYFSLYPPKIIGYMYMPTLGLTKFKVL